LDDRSTYVEETDDNFYRTCAGSGLLGTFYLLKQTPTGIDPLSPKNLLIFSNSVIAGYQAAGLGRYIVTSKSPLTNGVGETRCEGS
jgi:aldehyde:ferredoxin oxidoreductase